MARRKLQRADWGTIIARKNNRGEVVAWQARYVNPLDPRKRVQRNFKPDQKLRAENWLADEHELVTLHELGKRTWQHPSERKKAEERSTVLFSDYARAFLESYRGKDGKALTEASLRKKREAVNHLNEFFGGIQLADINETMVNSWLDGGYVQGIHSLRRAYQTLKAIMGKACSEEGGEEPILKRNPCTRPNPRLPKSRQAMIPPATSAELSIIYEAMPDYSRIAIYLGAVFGMRISEVCALQRSDIDLKHLRLYVRHSIGRGTGDRGSLRLKATKTESSEDWLPIPAEFTPMLKNHLREYCDSDPNAMVITPRNTAIMSPNTLRTQFENARAKAGRQDLHFHTLRATGITAAAQQGGTPKEVQRFGRHADAEISLQLYQRATEAGETALSDRVFESLVAPEVRQSERTPATVSRELKQAEEDLKDLEGKRQQLAAHIEHLRSELDGLNKREQTKKMPA